MLTILGFQQFLTQDSEVTLDLVGEGMNEYCIVCLHLIQLFVYILGKEHIKREKRRRQRLAESVTRRRDFAHRFGGSESNSRGK